MILKLVTRYPMHKNRARFRPRLEALGDRLAPASVQGTVWHDTNSDGAFDGTEGGVAGVAVDVYSTADVRLGTTTTDDTGAYAFTDPTGAAGYYLVVRPPG